MIDTVAIVGVGLIGGSFGLALKAAGFRGRVVGVSSPATLQEARERGAIDAGLDLADASGIADLIYLSQPIGRIVDTLRHLDAVVKPGALVTDAGSTKHAIVTAAREHLKRAQFLGGHPMAGKETRGVSGADANLFRDRPYVLTPGDPQELATEKAKELLSWIESIGARLVTLGAEEHDHLVAYSSHMPQLASTALAAVIGEESPDAVNVGGPGLMDVTRLALSSYELWRDILATNTGAIEEALSAYIGKLEFLRENLRTRAVQEEFVKAGEMARRLRELPRR